MGFDNLDSIVVLLIRGRPDELGGDSFGRVAPTEAFRLQARLTFCPDRSPMLEHSCQNQIRNFYHEQFLYAICYVINITV